MSHIAHKPRRSKAAIVFATVFVPSVFAPTASLSAQPLAFNGDGDDFSSEPDAANTISATIVEDGFIGPDPLISDPPILEWNEVDFHLTATTVGSRQTGLDTLIPQPSVMEWDEADFYRKPAKLADLEVTQISLKRLNEQANTSTVAATTTVTSANATSTIITDTATASTDATAINLPPLPAAKKPKSNPIFTRFVASQFLSSIVSGDAGDTLRYGGKADLYLDIKGSAFGFDDSINLHFHPEFRYGQSSNGEVGLLPSNTALFYPGDDGEKFDLSINITKKWSNGTSLTIGKSNILDLAAHLPVVGGGGHEGFQNLAMALPPSAIIPGSITGAMLTVPTKKALFRLWVFDPQSSSGRSGLSNPFDKGVAFLGSVTVPTKIGGQPGYYALKLAGSTRSEIAAEALPSVMIPPSSSGFGNKKGEFSAVLAGYQFLDTYEGMPGKGWGIFGQIYASNGDPTFLDASGFIGIAGNPKFRPQDRFGVAWFRYSLTDSLVDTLATTIPLEDEEGVEAFYTVGLNKNFRMTADVQIVDSAVAPRDLGVTATLRLTANF